MKPAASSAHFDSTISGPRVYSYEELLRALAREADLKRILIPLPFAASVGGKYARADVAESLGQPAGRKRSSHELETKARLHCDETGTVCTHHRYAGI